MTTRDEFAKAAMERIMQAFFEQNALSTLSDTQRTTVAREAYDMSEAMCQEKGRREEQEHAANYAS